MLKHTKTLNGHEGTDKQANLSIILRSQCYDMHLDVSVILPAA